MVFELKILDYIRIIFVIVISGLMILLGVLICLSIMENLNSLQEIFSKNNFPMFIIALISLIWGMRDYINLLKIFFCNCKSININKDGQFIIMLKRVSTIELSIEEIKDIAIKDYELGRRIYFDVLRINTKSSKTYKLATFHSTKLHDIVKKVKDIIKKRNIYNKVCRSDTA